jgi:hypothetical protein
MSTWLPRFWLHSVMTVAEIFLRHENRGGDDRFADLLDLRQFRQLGRVFDMDGVPSRSRTS